VKDDPTDAACSLTTPNAFKQVVAIPAGTTYPLRCSTTSSTVTATTSTSAWSKRRGHGRREQRRRDGERDCQHREPGGR
jgi:hypothetical protein